MEQILTFINGLNRSQKLVIAGGFLSVFLFLIGLMIYTNIKSEDSKFNHMIASHLTKNEVMLASNELEASGIQYIVVGNGNNLMLKTTKEHINVAKLKLLTSQTSVNPHSGWEIFDKSSLGTTNFENKIKYKRALEGELSRSLESLNGILSANVKLGQPKESIFTQRKTDPTASAMLTLREGTTLTKRQISGIKNFIASAVPKLQTKNIKLINQDGALLEFSKEDMQDNRYIKQEKYKQKLEAKYEKKIIGILEPFIGTNKVVAKVTIVLDFTQQEMNQEIYAPEGTIRSQQTSELSANKSEKKDETGGVPGTQSNIQLPLEGGDGKNKSQSSKEETKNTVNYEISKKVISKKNNAFASVTRLAAAVTFDSDILKNEPKRAQFLKNINDIVEETVGFKKDRGDKVTVKPFKFISIDHNDKSKNGIEPMLVKTIVKDFGDYIQYFIVAILLIIFYRKFVISNDIDLIDKNGTPDDDFTNYDDIEAANQSFMDKLEEQELEKSEQDALMAKNRLKAKVRYEIFNHIENIDDENIAKYEVLVEEIEKTIEEEPEEIAAMIEMLIFEGDAKLKGRSS